MIALICLLQTSHAQKPQFTEQLILGRGEPQASSEDGNVIELCRTLVHLLSSRYGITYHTPFPEIRGARQIEVLVPGHQYRILVHRNYTPSQ